MCCRNEDTRCSKKKGIPGEPSRVHDGGAVKASHPHVAQHWRRVRTEMARLVKESLERRQKGAHYIAAQHDQALTKVTMRFMTEETELFRFPRVSWGSQHRVTRQSCACGSILGLGADMVRTHRFQIDPLGGSGSKQGS